MKTNIVFATKHPRNHKTLRFMIKTLVSMPCLIYGLVGWIQIGLKCISGFPFLRRSSPGWVGRTLPFHSFLLLQVSHRKDFSRSALSQVFLFTVMTVILYFSKLSSVKEYGYNNDDGGVIDHTCRYSWEEAGGPSWLCNSLVDTVSWTRLHSGHWRVCVSVFSFYINLRISLVLATL